MQRIFGRLCSISLLVALGFLPSAHAAWRRILPASGGTISQIVTDANGVLYTFTSVGLFKSADLGQTWSSITGNLALPSSVSLAADPVTPGVVYLGTDHGLYRTKDGGFSWSLLSLSTTSPIQLIAVARTNPNFIFIATSGDYLYRSLDGGATWSQQTQGISNAPNARFITSIAVDPTNANRVYTSTWRGFLFRSDDAAATFTQISDSGIWANGQMYIAPSSPNVLYMTHDERFFGRGTILKSADFGDTWANVGQPSGVPTDAGQIAISPNDPNTLYVTTGLGISKTTTGGGNWTLILTPATLPLRSMQAIAINPSNPTQVFAGSSYFGFYLSMDSGATWFPFNNGIAGATITGIEICRDNPSIIYVGVQTIGFMKSSDGGATWNLIGTGQNLQNLSLVALGVHPQDSNTLLVATAGGGDASNNVIWRSADGGSTFTQTIHGYAPGELRFNPLSPNFVSASIADFQGGFLFSSDIGSTWSVPAPQYIYPGDYVYHPKFSNIVLTVGNQYTGAPRDSVYTMWSNNSGVNWSQSSFLGEGNLTALAIDNDQTTLYVAGTLAGEGTQGVYKFSISYSGSNVASITRVPGTFNNGLPNTSIRHLYYDGATGYLYASTPTGIFRSNNQALSWSSITSGLPNLSTDIIASTPDGKRLLVATGGGVWEYTDTPPSTPVVSLTPTALTFGSQPQGTPTTRSVLLSNKGDGALAINGISSSNPTEFAVGNPCPSTLNPGASCSVNVTFTPSGPGLRTATLVFADNTFDSPQAVLLSGTGLPPGSPSVSLAPTSLIFPNQPLGTTSDVKTVSLANTGAASLLISNITATGDFHSPGNSCGGTLSAGSSCTIQVTFSPTVSGSSNGQLLILDNAFDSPQSAPLSGPSMLDTDGDGIPDDWERFGVSISGVFLDLPAMGANWLRKDLFVKTDWMEASDHSHRPNPDAITKLIAAFANAPVNNPNGSTGIALHLDCGPTCIMNPVTGTPWGTFSQASALLHLDPISGNVDQLGSTSLLGGYDWSSFDAIKAVNLSPVRSPVFHYVVFAHDLFGLAGSSGLARTTPGSDAIVSLGSYTKSIGTVPEQAGTLMHELGHNLGLAHGGVDPIQKILDSVNYKPNFLSVMNYLFQTRGLIAGGLEGNLDFSRFILPTLVENSLDEHLGLNSPLVASYGTRYFCPNATVDTLVMNAAGPIDWNCNGSLESGVMAEITGQLPLLILLPSYNDWVNLNFTGGSIGQPGAPPPAKQTMAQEITQQQDAKITTVHGVAVAGPTRLALPLGGNANLAFALTNKGNIADTYVINATTTQTWVDLTGVPAQVVLPPSGTLAINLPIQAPAFVTSDQAVAEVMLRATSLANSLVLDSARTTISVGSADLAATVSHSPDPVFVGNNLTYTISITNSGNDAASNVVLTDTLPPNVTALSASFESGSCVGSGLIKCALGSLASGAKATVTIVVTPSASGSLMNTASVTSSVYDPIPANNSVMESAVVIGKPSVAAQISGQSKTGTTATVTVIFTNVGTGAASNASVNQVLLRTLAGSGTVTFAGPPLPLSLGTLAQGESKLITLTLNVPSTVTQFSLSERGTMQDSIGNVYSFGTAQSIRP